MYSVDIMQNGQALPKITHQGRTFVASNPGPYTIRVSNTSSGRVEAVVAVDQRNVISGEKEPNFGRGYLLTAGQTSTIPGWTRSNSEVAAFEFTADPTQGYNAQMTGSAEGSGVIGVAFFQEKVKAAPLSMTMRGGGDHDTKGSIGSHMSIGGGGLRCTSNSAPKGPDMATAYGHSQAFHTTSVSFERREGEPSVISIYYASAAVLESWGVPVPKVTMPNSLPDPFGRDEKFSKAPPNWRG